MFKSLLAGAFAFVAGLAIFSVSGSTILAAPATKQTGPVLLELFTSQGCSSCPPADRLMAELSRSPGLLVITRPVTYWDRLGWKDTLARDENTRLQRAYAHKGHRGAGVYTPQVVVNGGMATVGSRRREILELARNAQHAAVIAVKPDGQGGYGVGVSGENGQRAELMLVALDSSERVSIGRGENSGRSLTYTNVVRDEQRLGEWRSGTQAFTVSASSFSAKAADRYALVLRVPDGGPVLAARMIPES